jgi:predicted HicB family RNase H-like nuclease
MSLTSTDTRRVAFKATRAHRGKQLGVRCPPILHKAIVQAARRNLSNTSDYVRQVLVERLRAEGVNFDEIA